MIAQLFSPWRRVSTWWSLTHSVLNFFVGTATFTLFLFLGTVAVSFIVLFPITILTIWFVFIAARICGAIERTRYQALLGIELADPVPPLSDRNWFWRLAERFTSLARWRELAYLLLLFPLGILTASVVVSAWVGGALMLAYPLYVNALPEGSTLWGISALSTSIGTWIAALLGLLTVALLAPWLTVAMGAVSAQIGRWLLGTDREAELEHEVEALELSRSAAIDSAEAERRRIERDLHDGAQQRLVALALDLGVARSKPDLTVEESRQVITRSHEEVKAAMKELRDLVRGVHPVVLEDRGLDAALSGIVARSPVPVRLNVTVAERLPPAIESAAYFVVSEALTNVARHSQATQASVTIALRAERLIIEITDNGIGGADAARGTGLHGLGVRASSLAGWMRVVSPAGGPTTIIVELPCE